MLKQNQAELVRQLTKLTATGGSLKDPTLILFTANPGTLPDQPVPADLTRPTYTTYADVAPASWGAVVAAPDGSAEVVGPATTFSVTTTGAANTIFGAALLDTAGTNVIGIDVFDVPEVLTSAGDGFTYIPRFNLRSAA